MFPTTQGPVFNPIPTCSGLYVPPFWSASCLNCRLSLSARASISRPASQALTSCCGSSSGAFQNAMIASPMYLSIVPIALDDGVRQRSQKTIHQPRQTLRIVLVGLGNRREPADVAEQDCHPALFAAEHELLGRTCELFHERGGQVEAEGGANLLALLLFLEIIHED